jgi:hypothetical protein
MKKRLFFCTAYRFMLSFVLVCMAVPSFGQNTPLKYADVMHDDAITSLKLSACIDAALRNNPDLQYSSDEKNIAEHDLAIAQSERWPDVKLKGGVTRFTNEQRLVPASYNGEQGIFGKNMSDIGVTVLIGIVVMMGGITSQGVVLISLAEAYRGKNMTALEAMRAAAPVRVRPILMTQLTTVLGLVPLALNLGEGGDMLQPMAIAVIGGLSYSLLLTLFFLPSAYCLMFRNNKVRSAQIGRSVGETVPEH